MACIPPLHMLQLSRNAFPKHTPSQSLFELDVNPVFPPLQISQSSIIALPKQVPVQSLSELKS